MTVATRPLPFFVFSQVPEGMIVRMRAALAVALAATLSGCHLVLPLAGPGKDTSPDRDDRADQRADTPGVDGPAGPVDSPPLETTLATCACSVGDCDGLPDARDPEPSRCNELLYEETFATDPLTGGRWSTVRGDWSWTAGWLHQGAVDNDEATFDFYWARSNDASLPNRSYLVEVRLRLGAVDAMQDWDAAIVARMSDTLDVDQNPVELLTCNARMDTKDSCADCNPPQKIINPDLKVETRNSLGWYGSWPRLNPSGLYDPAAGQTYLLQLWVQGGTQPQVNCLLSSDADGKPLRLAYRQMWGSFDGDTKYVPTGIGTVGLRTWDRAVSYDYVRVFALHEQGAL